MIKWKCQLTEVKAFLPITPAGISIEINEAGVGSVLLAGEYAAAFLPTFLSPPIFPLPPALFFASHRGTD